MRLDTAQMLLPAEMLAVDLAQVGDEEGVLVPYATFIVVNGLDAGLEGVPNQLLALQITNAMVELAAEIRMIDVL